MTIRRSSGGSFRSEVSQSNCRVSKGIHLHSQLAFFGSYNWIVSMLRRPWEVAKMVLGSTPNSAPILQVMIRTDGVWLHGGKWWGRTCASVSRSLKIRCQCMVTEEGWVGMRGTDHRLSRRWCRQSRRGVRQKCGLAEGQKRSRMV